MTISALLGEAGEPLTVEHAGKTYRATGITQKVKSAWERWLYDDATAALHDACKGMPPEAQGEAAARLAARRHEFSFFAPKSLEAFQTFAGQIKMASLLFGVTHEEAEALALARPAQVVAVIETLFAESFGAVIAFGAMQKQKAEGAEGKAPPR